MAVVLVLVGASFDWEVGEGSRDPWQKEVDHGPQLFQSVLERIADEENSLLAEKHADMADFRRVSSQAFQERQQMDENCIQRRCLVSSLTLEID